MARGVIGLLVIVAIVLVLLKFALGQILSSSGMIGAQMSPDQAA